MGRFVVRSGTLTFFYPSNHIILFNRSLTCPASPFWFLRTGHQVCASLSGCLYSGLHGLACTGCFTFPTDVVLRALLHFVCVCRRVVWSFIHERFFPLSTDLSTDRTVLYFLTSPQVPWSRSGILFDPIIWCTPEPLHLTFSTPVRLSPKH